MDVPAAAHPVEAGARNRGADAAAPMARNSRPGRCMNRAAPGNALAPELAVAVAEGRSPVTDIVELMHAEHVRIGELIGKLDDALTAAWPAGTGSDPGPVWAALASFLPLYLDAAEEIVYQALAGAAPDAALAITRASEASADTREAVKEALLFPAGSRAWDMAVRAACSAVKIHISCMESGPLTRYQRHAAPAARNALGLSMGLLHDGPVPGRGRRPCRGRPHRAGPLKARRRGRCPGWSRGWRCRRA